MKLFKASIEIADTQCHFTQFTEKEKRNTDLL